MRIGLIVSTAVLAVDYQEAARINMALYAGAGPSMRSFETDGKGQRNKVGADLREAVATKTKDATLREMELSSDLDIFDSSYYERYNNARARVEKELELSADTSVEGYHVGVRVIEKLESEGIYAHPVDNSILSALEFHELNSTLRNKNKLVLKDFTIANSRIDNLPAMAHAYKGTAQALLFFKPGPQPGVGDTGELLDSTGLIGLDDASRAEIIRRLVSYSRKQFEREVTQFPNLDAKAIYRYGMLFTFNLRIEMSCVNLRELASDYRTTRVLTSLFGSGTGYIPTEHMVDTIESIKTSTLNQSAIKPIIDRLVPLRNGPLDFFGYIGNNFIRSNSPHDFVENDLQLTKSFNHLTSLVIKNYNNVDSKRTRSRPPRTVPTENLKAILSPISAHLGKYFKDLTAPAQNLDFQLQSLGNLAEPIYGNKCDESNLYMGKDIIEDACIALPVASDSVYADERFLIQCRAWYPLRSIGVVVHTTEEMQNTDESSVMDVYTCTPNGWESMEAHAHLGSPHSVLDACRRLRNRTIDSESQNSSSPTSTSRTQ